MAKQKNKLIAKRRELKKQKKNSARKNKKTNNSNESPYIPHVQNLGGYKIKISEVINKFALPMTSEANEETFRSALEMTILFWNLTFLPYKEALRNLTDFLDPSEHNYFLKKFKIMYDNKHKEYKEDDRYIEDYKITGTGGDLYLVISAIPYGQKK